MQQMFSRRRVIAGIGAAGSVTLLAACGGATAGGETQPPAAKKDVTIKVTARLANEADMWPIRVPQFHEKYPNVTIQPDLHAGDIQEKIATLIASGDIGDVVHTHFSAAQPQRLYLGKSMRELDSLFARDKLDLKQWYPQAIDAGRVDNKVIALPFKGKMATVALFFNQTLFEQAGLKPPDLHTSLNDLVDLAVKLTRPDGSQWGLGGFMPDVARNVTGVGGVNAMLDRLGCPRTRLHRYFGKPEMPGPPGPSQAVPREIGRLLEGLARREILTPELCQQAMVMLRRQSHRALLPRLLPEGTAVAHKTGSLDGVRHDAGVIWRPSPTGTPQPSPKSEARSPKSGALDVTSEHRESAGAARAAAPPGVMTVDDEGFAPGHPVVLVAMSREVADLRWTVENEAERTIARAAKVVYEHLTRNEEQGAKVRS